MALIEHLERDNWRRFFSEMFRHTRWVLRHDRYGHVGSSASDLRAWLIFGGIPRVRQALDRGMANRRFPDDRAAQVREHIEVLVRDNRSELLALPRDGIIPNEEQPMDLSVEDVESALERISRGERPFEEWMYAHGHTYRDLTKGYKIIDRWLAENGIIAAPGPRPRLQ